VGIDVIAAQPPRGVSTILGNFLSEEIQREVRAYVADLERGRARGRVNLSRESTVEEGSFDELVTQASGKGGIQSVDVTAEELAELERGYIDLERAAHLETASQDVAMPLHEGDIEESEQSTAKMSLKDRDTAAGRVVDVVLSDMWAPWPQTSGFSRKSINDAYRMMNTSGNGFRDHVKSMVRRRYTTLCKD
jgi:21S rRNA (uridine2791-2'-O)-methyltransferase